VSDETPFTK